MIVKGSKNSVVIIGRKSFMWRKCQSRGFWNVEFLNLRWIICKNKRHLYYGVFRRAGFFSSYMHTKTKNYIKMSMSKIFMIKWREPRYGLYSNKHHLYFIIILRSVGVFSYKFVYFDMLEKFFARLPFSIQAAIWFRTFVLSSHYCYLN